MLNFRMALLSLFRAEPDKQEAEDLRPSSMLAPILPFSFVAHRNA